MKKRREPGPAGNWDYVEHGSDEHAAQLGLKKAKEGDEPQLEGWALVDLTLYGPNATDKFLKEMLCQKVSELTTKPVEYQDKDPHAPNYAPPMWTPEVGTL